MLFVMVTISLFFCALPCRGQESIAVSDTNSAKHYFQRGVVLFSKQDYAGAESAFQTSYSLLPKPLVLFNIAMTQKAQYRYRDAIATFRQYLETEALKSDDLKRGQAEQAIEEMEALLESSRDTPGPIESKRLLPEQHNGHESSPEDQCVEPKQEIEHSISKKTITAIPKPAVHHKDVDLFMKDNEPKKRSRPIAASTSTGKEIGLIVGAALAGGFGLGATGLGSYFSYLRENRDLNNAESVISEDDYNEVSSRARAHVAASAVCYTAAGILFATSAALIVGHRMRNKKKSKNELVVTITEEGISLAF